MRPDSDRLASIIGAAMVEAIDRAVDARLPELLSRTMPTPEGYLGTARAAEIAGVKPDTVLNWISRGLLPATRPPGTKQWRIRPADLEAVLAGAQAGQAPVLDLSKQRQARADALAAAVKGEGGR